MQGHEPVMTRYEYKVIPAPQKGLRGKGVKGAEGKFAHSLETVMNDLAREGWEYQRADTLPSEERSGLTSKTTVFRNVLVFRRAVVDQIDALDAKLLDPPSSSDEAGTQPLETPTHATSDPDQAEPHDAGNAQDDERKEPRLTSDAPTADVTETANTRL